MELSSKIKAMKFMKRKEDAEERRKQEEQQRTLAEQGHWRVAPSNTCSQPKFRVEYDSSLAGSNTGSAASARLSYGKFNPEIEKMAEEERRRILKSRSGDGKTVSDTEMAAALAKPHMSSLGGPSEISTKRPRE